MNRAQQLAALREDLRASFPTSQSVYLPGQRLHRDHSGLSTGLSPLDERLTGHGLPRGRISELTGSSSCGKTALAFQIIAQTCRQQPVAYIDLGGCFYPPTAELAGINLQKLLLVRVDTPDQALKAADILLRGQAFPLVVLDWGLDAGNAPSSTELGTAIGRLNALCAQSQAVLLFITTPKTARDPIRYYATLRLEVQRSAPEPLTLPPEATEPAGGTVLAFRRREPLAPRRLVGIPTLQLGSTLNIHVIKNKLGPSGTQIGIRLRHNEASRLPLHSGIPDTTPPAR